MVRKIGGTMRNIPANKAHDLRKWLIKNPDNIDQANDLFKVNLTSGQMLNLMQGNFIYNMPEFTFYRKPITNLLPARSINICQLYKAIKSDYYADVTRELRSITDNKKQGEFKKYSLDYITPSGTFEARNDKNLINRSFYIVIDFDKTSDPEKIKSVLLNDQHIKPDLIFTSPRGNGLKALIYDQDHAEHDLFYNAVQGYFESQYPELFQNFDTSNKNISRACFLCHDPDVYINPDILELWQAQQN
jgi:hypothetical protein